MKNRCVFFDRDGIVNVSPGPGYVERHQDFYLIPAFIDCAKIAIKHGYQVAIATNQRGVARGIMSADALAAIHAKLRSILSEHNISLMGIYCCTHERDSCDCRKPQPGMLLQAALEHNLDLAESWMVGDSETDIQAGQRAGCHTIRVCPNREQTTADFRAASMVELAQKLPAWICHENGS
jgi:D-glycero-D-manno-heptose 1,7-bisphosphate phosphatase